MRFSVIVPAFQCKNTIRTTIESILQANLYDLEIIIVDDGSTDGTADICENLSRCYSEVIYYRQENKGVSAARNYGLRKATGDYVLFVDADDKLRPFNMRDIENAVQEQADIILFGIQFCYFWRGRLVRREVKSCSVRLIDGIHNIIDDFQELFDSNYLSAVWNKIIRRSLVIENQLFFDERLTNYEDLEFSIQIIRNSTKVYVLPEEYYIYNNDYNVDRTINRIAKIDDIMQNTDIIVSAFQQLDNDVFDLSGEHIKHIDEIILQIYLEIFFQKTKTASISMILKYCEDFLNDDYVSKSMARACNAMKKNWVLAQIKNKNAKSLWLRSRYSVIRHWFANRIKIALLVLGVKNAI